MDLDTALKTSPNQTAVYDGTEGYMSVRIVSPEIMNITVGSVASGRMLPEDVNALVAQLGIPTDQGWQAKKTNE